MSVPVFDTFTVGEKVTAAKLNTNIRDAGNFFKSRPYVKVRSDVVQNLSTGVWTSLAWNIEDEDTDGMWVSGANKRLTCVTPGLYMPFGVVGLAADNPDAGIGRRGTRLIKNSVPEPGTGTVIAAGTVQSQCFALAQTPVRMAVGDFIAFDVFQDSGATLVTNGSANEQQPCFGAIWIGA